MTATVYTGGATCEVIARPPVLQPTIANFAATPAMVTLGQSVVLSADVTNAVSLLLNGAPVTLPATVFPPDTGAEIYTLTAIGMAGSTPATATLTVTVNAVVVPPSVFDGIHSKPIDLNKTLMMQGYMSAPLGYDPGRYEREQYLCILTGSTAQFRATTNNFAAGGAKIQFGASATLTLCFDGVPVATKTVAATDYSVVFTVDLTNIAEGWYRTTVTGLDVSWSILDYAAYVLKGAKAQPQSKMPVVTGSYTLKKDMTTVSAHHFAWVPAQCVPTIMPLVPRDCPAFSEIPKRQNVVITQLVHGRVGDTYRPSLTKEGIMVTAGKQPYYFYDFQKPAPTMPLLDGPRGQGSLFCPTHVEVGKCAPTAKEGAALGPIDNAYFTDPWRVGKVREDGTVVTLAGWRHTTTPQYWADPVTAELVGDWSAIPAARRGFVELWGMAWRIPAIDYAAAPIATERGLKPHVTGVQMFVSDQRRVMPNGTGRIVKLQFSPTSHAAPPVVTEFHGDGWNQCFDVVGNGHQVHGQTPVSDADFRLWASDRMGHSIRVLGFDGTVLETWANIPQPEGLALFERADGLWLYYTSTVRAGGTETGTVQNFYIRRRHTVTKEDVLIVDCKAKFPQLVGNNTLIGKIAISDGSFGPKGMIALATWANSNFSYPILIDGETGDLIDWLYPMQYSEPIVFGMGNPGMTYTSAVGIGNGRMVWGTACEGLIMVSKALPTDTVWPASVAAGEKQWHDEGYIAAYGHYGFGHYGLPLPWGASSNIDAFLQAHGHIKA